MGGREPRDEGRLSLLRQRDRDDSAIGDHLAAPSRGAGGAQGQPGAFLTVKGEFEVDEAAASRAAVDDAKVVGCKVSPCTAGAAVDGVADLKGTEWVALGVVQGPGACERGSGDSPYNSKFSALSERQEAGAFQPVEVRPE